MIVTNPFNPFSLKLNWGYDSLTGTAKPVPSSVPKRIKRKEKQALAETGIT